MKRIAVAVEGASDKIFWEKVLNRSFARTRFNIRDLKGLRKLLNAAPELYDTFQDAHYDALFYLVDADDLPCASGVRPLFDGRIQTEIARHKSDRWSFLAVAIRELESWYLADTVALEHTVGNSAAEIPATGGKSALVRFMRESLGRRLGYDERQFAGKMAVHFDPARARKNSASFDYFWSCMEAVLAR